MARAAVKLQFEVSPQTSRIGRGGRTLTPGVGEIMTLGNSTLVQTLIALRSRVAGYQPERHYMRGPGPKTLSKLGEAFRDETEGDVRERIPEQWLTLMSSIAERERDR